MISGSSNAVLRITEPPEPLSLDHEEQGNVVLVSSSALEILLGELRRYAAGQISGRSFLISGHRGAGKTTLVKAAIATLVQEQRRASARAESTSDRTKHHPARPLLIPLSGPALLEPVPRTPSGQKPPPDTSNPGSAPASPESNRSKAAHGNTNTDGRRLILDDIDWQGQVLVEIITALCQRTIAEFGDRFRYHVETTEATADEVPHPRRNDLMELAEELRRVLDDLPEAHELRAFWERAESLGSGVLDTRSIDGAGLREVATLHRVLQVFRRVSGVYKNVSTEIVRTNDVTRNSSFSLDVVKDVVTPFASLIIGAMVGYAVYSGPKTGIESAIAGLVAGLAGAGILKYSSTRKVTEKSTQSEIFERDRTIRTLDREIPALIRALWDVGLTPVFQVDELDKVSELSDVLPKLLRRLKQLFAEDCFFCFLTDRASFERVSAKVKTGAYPEEATLFTQRVYVGPNAADVVQYIDRVVSLDRPGNPDDERDRELFGLHVRHRSRLHIGDLRGLLRRYRRANGECALSLSDMRERRVLQEALVQLAIECVAQDEDILHQTGENPLLERWMTDALYYVSRRWNEAWQPTPDDPLIRFDNAGRDTFVQYLGSRIDRTAEEAAADNPGHDLHLAAPEIDWLLRVAHRVAGLCADSPALADAIRETQSRSNHPNASPILALDSANEVLPLLDDILRSGPHLLLAPAEEAADCFRLLYDSLGVAIPESASKTPDDGETESGANAAGPTAPTPAGEGSKALAATVRISDRARDLIRGFIGALEILQEGPRTITPEHFARIRAIGSVPPWSSVERVLSQPPRSLGPSEEKTLVDYLDNITRNRRSRRMAEVLRIAFALGNLPPSDPEEALEHGMNALIRLLRLPSVNDHETLDKALRQLHSELQLDSPSFSGSSEAPRTGEDWQQFAHQLKRERERYQDFAAPNHKQRALELATDWLKQADPKRELPTVGEVWCEIHEELPTRLVRRNPAAMSIGDWADVFALTNASNEERRSIPQEEWRQNALRHLGFDIGPRHPTSASADAVGARRTPPAGGASFSILLSSNSTKLWNSPVDNSYLVLPIRAEYLQRQTLFPIDNDQRALLGRVENIFLEHESLGHLNRSTLGDLRLMLKCRRIVWIYSEDPGKQARTPFVVGAKRVADLSEFMTPRGA